MWFGIGPQSLCGSALGHGIDPWGWLVSCAFHLVEFTSTPNYVGIKLGFDRVT